MQFTQKTKGIFFIKLKEYSNEEVLANEIVVVGSKLVMRKSIEWKKL